MAEARVRTAPILGVAAVVATCGLVYELLAGCVASWFLGDTVTQFSLVLGGYLGALGLGAHLSQFITRDPPRAFVRIEIGVALTGGLTTALLFATGAHPWLFRGVLAAGVVTCGTLVGLEIPVLVRVLETHAAFRETIARVLLFDHVGSLAGSLLFALVAMPWLGPLRTAAAFGALNAVVALASTFLLRAQIARPWTLRVGAFSALAALLTVFAMAEPIARLAEPAR